MSTPILAQLIHDYFYQYLISQRNVSGRTVASYRDTFRLLLRYLAERFKKTPSQIAFDDLNVRNIEAFLSDLEKRRNNSARTRNNRFAAIRSFLKWASGQDPGFLPLVQQVLAMPMKRFDRRLLGFLSREEVKAILDTADSSTWSGRRDRVMFATLYNTGARVSELIGLKIQDVSLESSPYIRIRGKGRKERIVPLWKDTTRHLKGWLKGLDAEGQMPIFPNAAGKSLTRAGVEYRLKRMIATAALHCESLRDRAISPHTFRHTTAMHLLQSGVDLTVIALWLGHESPTTTHMYVEADLSMKQRALEKLQEPKCRGLRYQPGDKLLQFLEGL